jgi:CDP-glucose 4,6-dehydratase
MPHPFSAFYHGKRVLVTGHTGFQGGWLVAWLKLLGAKVLGYGLPPATRPNFFDATLLDRGSSSIFADIRDRNALTNAFTEFQPEIVIHCAWRSTPPGSFVDPVETFATNTMGTLHILEEARLTKSVRAVVFATSGSCYENRNWFWAYREEDALGGNDPYSASLAAAELAASAYMRSVFQHGKTAIASARLASALGGGDWAEHRPVAAIVHSIADGQPAKIHDPHDSRQYQHVLESARACLQLAQCLYEQGQSCSGAWNFAPAEDQVVSQRELVEMINGQWKAKTQIVVPDQRAQKKQPFRLNSRKAQTQLGWHSALDLQDAIAWTVEWYRAFDADPSSAWHTTEAQIEQYMKCTTGQLAMMKRARGSKF